MGAVRGVNMATTGACALGVRDGDRLAGSPREATERSILAETFPPYRTANFEWRAISSRAPLA